MQVIWQWISILIRNYQIEMILKSYASMYFKNKHSERSTFNSKSKIKRENKEEKKALNYNSKNVMKYILNCNEIHR